MSIKILFLAGSAREGSLNKSLARAACDMASEHENVSAEFIDLKDYPMPIYDGDLEKEKGLPDNAITLKKKFITCDGFFIASPEYNSGYSSLLKNTIDWMSRSHEQDEKPLIAYKDKVAAIAAVSSGMLGGLRGLVPLRMLLGNIGVHVTPSQAAIGNGMNAFDDKGKLSDDKQKVMLQNVVDELIKTTKALQS
ncbi:MAG: NAD(P)H-dependent oxidoreductase [Alphaproteobacteria bacterium]|nr:NAD(P)H-dependent oxidoreductase [Alphaproteobacteria bacterium]NCQ88560.1 NAD(P)H-dependent oxidoreductase [Alphaproteobacteria bacterium]NCT06103.1 NAD(P)H-dependent oxidoreductase [Alphaproteobacteria bacterium]